MEQPRDLIVRPLSITIIALFASTLLFCGLLVSHIFLAGAQRTGTVEIRVDQGDSFATIVRKLEEQDLVRNATLFSLWARLTGSDKKIQWGLYRFDLPLSAREILRLMVHGKGVFHRVTIPEGLTTREIAEVLANAQLADPEKFLAEARNPELLAQLGLDGRGVEGYLFPSTYNFIPDISERDIIATMVQQFRRAAEPLFERQERAFDLTVHQIVTLASMIEKETGMDAERPLVSAVFHNRLRLKMPMQSDPTVIYGLEKFDGHLTRKHLKHPSPYNTYVIGGLPPGPICNPGLASIKAALEPAEVSFLYFVSRNDGTHVFSETLEEHVRAVRIYQSPREPAPARVKTEARPG